MKPGQWQASQLTGKSIELFKERCLKYGFSPMQVLPHDGYLINLGKVVTKVAEAKKFWPAENYHQDYYKKKGSQPFCHRYTQRF